MVPLGAPAALVACTLRKDVRGGDLSRERTGFCARPHLGRAALAAEPNLGPFESAGAIGVGPPPPAGRDRPDGDRRSSRRESERIARLASRGSTHPARNAVSYEASPFLHLATGRSCAFAGPLVQPFCRSWRSARRFSSSSSSRCCCTCW